MVVTLENWTWHTPLLTTARYWVVVVRFKYCCEVAVLMIGVHVVPLSVDDSQRRMAPTWPVSVIVPELLPAHTEASAAVVPPTVAGSTTTVTVLEFEVHGACGVIDHVN